MGDIAYLPVKRDDLLNLTVRPHLDTIWGHQRKFAIIVTKDDESGLEWIHPLTDFVLYFWDNSAYLTMRNHALTVVQFLNFIFVEELEKHNIHSLYQLGAWHASRYLNHLGKTNGVDSVRRQRRTLVRFYHFLSVRGFLPLVDSDKFVIAVNPENKRVTYHYPFPNIILPSDDRDDDIIHWFDPSLIIPFIETTFEEANNIALGIWMMVFGGLRVGDVVNLRHQDVSTIGGSYGEQGLRLKVRERFLRKNIKDASGTTGVKKPGTRVVFNYKTWVPLLYKNHVKRYRPTDGSDALFVNTNGEAMTGKDFRYYFEKVKKAFIQKLYDHGTTASIMMALHLESHKWSCHIGRGLFSNMLAKCTNNPALLARFRGDDDLTSAITYIGSSEEVYKEIEKLLADFQRGIFACLGKKEISDGL